MSSIPKIEARLEHVTRKKERDRRKPEKEPSSWQDKLGSAEHEDPLVQKVATANGLPFPAEPAVNAVEHDQLKGAFDSSMREIDRLKRTIKALEVNGKKLERALAAEKVQRLDAELELLMIEMEA